MRFAFLCAAIVAVAPGWADEVVASNGEDSVRLSDQPCSSETVLNRLPPNLRVLVHDAVATVQGESFKACWVIDGDAAHLLYEDGDQGMVPLSDFRAPGDPRLRRSGMEI
jgi:hypothetical protein